MTIEGKNPITSEEYADLLIEASKTEAILKSIPGATAQPVNFLITLVNVPVDYITNYTVMELGYSVFPAIWGLVSQASLEASGIVRLRSIPEYDLRGQGVLVGIIDTGIDYTNPIFRNADGTTRIAAIWDQTIQSGKPPEGFLYGTEYIREQINLALQSNNPYEVVPIQDENGHGTMVAGIAGGKEVPESNFSGVAPNVEYLVVKLKPAKEYLKKFFCIPEAAIGYQENDVAYAINYVLNGASRFSKPIAVCLAIDTSEGPHDGRGTFADYFTLVASSPGVAIALGTGNEGNAGRHYSGVPNKETGFDTVELKVGENEGNFIMQLWGEVPSIISVDILSPSGEYINKITPTKDEFYQFTFTNEKTVIYLDYQMVEPQSGTQLYFFRFFNPSAGIWRFNVYQKSEAELKFHIWLPMTGFISDNTYFIHPDPYTTTLAIANTSTPIKTTAYNDADDSLYVNAGRGFTRIGGITPNIASPGVNVLGPTLAQTFAEYTGTSVSAAYLTGVVSMLLEWGVVRGNMSDMGSAEIRNFIERGARRDLSLSYPNPDWGYGILDVFNIFEGMR